MDTLQAKAEARRLLYLNQPEAAASVLQNSMSAAGTDSEAHGLMGAIFSRLGRDADAVGHFEQAVRMDPIRAANHYNLGVAYEKAGRPDWALEGFRQALLREPTFEPAITAYYRLAPQLYPSPSASGGAPDGPDPSNRADRA